MYETYTYVYIYIIFLARKVRAGPRFGSIVSVVHLHTLLEPNIHVTSLNMLRVRKIPYNIAAFVLAK